MEFDVLMLAISGMAIFYLLANKALNAKRGTKKVVRANDELQSVYEHTIKELKSRVMGYSQRIRYLEKGAGVAVGKLNGEGEVGVDEIEQLYDEYVPAAIKAMIPFDVAKEYVEKHPDVIKKVVGKFKKEGDGQTPSGSDTI